MGNNNRLFSARSNGKKEREKQEKGQAVLPGLCNGIFGSSRQQLEVRLDRVVTAYLKLPALVHSHHPFVLP
jgi:hypothetical protein